MTRAPFSCTCGTIKGAVAGVPATGTHLLCYCDSCRAGANFCGAGHDAETPLDLYLTQPARVTIDAGADRLAPFAFSPKGIVRWKASCCGVQMFSTQANPKIAFMSVVTARFSQPEVVGPVTSKAFVPMPGGKTRHEGKGQIAKLVLAALQARMTGKWRKHPLFNAATLQPITPVKLISKAEKAALLPSTA